MTKKIAKGHIKDWLENKKVAQIREEQDIIDYFQKKYAEEFMVKFNFKEYHDKFLQAHEELVKVWDNIKDTLEIEYQPYQDPMRRENNRSEWEFIRAMEIYLDKDFIYRSALQSMVDHRCEIHTQWNKLENAVASPQLKSGTSVLKYLHEIGMDTADVEKSWKEKNCTEVALATDIAINRLKF